MVIKPRYRGFICTTVHPVGCKKNVLDQIEYIKSKGRKEGPTSVLVIGASTGYGLAARIAAAYGFGAGTVGVFFERPQSDGKTGSAGWYNNKSFEEQAAKDGLTVASLNGDAFSNELKTRTIDLIKSVIPGGKVDLVVYSLASPKRKDPDSDQVYNSVIKPIGNSFTGQ